MTPPAHHNAVTLNLDAQANQVPRITIPTWVRSLVDHTVEVWCVFCIGAFIAVFYLVTP